MLPLLLETIRKMYKPKIFYSIESKQCGTVVHEIRDTMKVNLKTIIDLCLEEFLYCSEPMHSKTALQNW